MPSYRLLGSTFLVSLTFSVVFLVAGPAVIKSVLQQQLILDNPLRLCFRVWQDTLNEHLYLRRRHYFFEITNPYDVYHNRSVPNFRKVGPFVYSERQYMPEERVFWAQDGSLGYQYHNDFEFIYEESIDETTQEQLTPYYKITNLNLALISLLFRVNRISNSSTQLTLCETLSIIWDAAGPNGTVVGDTGYFVRREVREWLYGYKDPIWEVIAPGCPSTGMYCPTQFQFVWNHSQPAPSPWTREHGQQCPAWDDQSICNKTSTQPSYMWSGVQWGAPLSLESDRPSTRGQISTMEQTGQITSWAGNDKLWWWGEDGDCQRIYGGNGMMYPPGLTEQDTPYVFVDTIFRKVKSQFSSYSEVKGIDAMKFLIHDDEIYLSNNSKCYFQKYSAVFNLTNVVYAPLFVSAPYFYKYDPEQILLDAVFPKPPGTEDRLALNATINNGSFTEYASAHSDDVETFLKVFPEAGVLLEGTSRLQSNTFLQPLRIPACNELGFFKNFEPKNPGPDGNPTSYFPETFVPFFYVNRYAVLSDELASYIKYRIIAAQIAFKVTGIVLLVCSLFVLVYVIFRFAAANTKANEGANSPKYVCDSTSPHGTLQTDGVGSTT